MLFSPALRKAAYALPIAFALASGAANAGGLTPGQCYAKADAEAVLKQEGQAAIIVGERLTTGSERPANVFFLNSQGYGYNIEGNAPLGVPSTKLCVAAAYKDVYLNSPNNPEIPSWAAGIKTTGNGIDIQKAYQKGARAVLGARTYSLKQDGAEAPGKYIVVVVGDDKYGGVWSVDSLGRPDTSFDMSKVGLTPKMADMVNNKHAAAPAAQGPIALVAR